jgi:hypothetical protein
MSGTRFSRAQVDAAKRFEVIQIENDSVIRVVLRRVDYN